MHTSYYDVRGVKISDLLYFLDLALMNTKYLQINQKYW